VGNQLCLFLRLEEKKVAIEEIKQVCIDMSPSFISGCLKYLPQAQITIKFDYPLYST